MLAPHSVDKLFVPILVVLFTMDNMVAFCPYLVETIVQVVVPDRIDLAIELGHIVACYIIPMVLRSMDLETNENCLGFDSNFDTK